MNNLENTYEFLPNDFELAKDKNIQIDKVYEAKPHWKDVLIHLSRIKARLWA